MKRKTLDEQIQYISKQIRELSESIKLYKADQSGSPREFQVDESAYPALAEIRAVMAEADRRQMHDQQLQMLEQSVEDQREELRKLLQVKAEKLAEIERIKEFQSEVFERYQELEQAALPELQKLVGFAQLIVDLERDGLDENPSPPTATFHDRAVATTIKVVVKGGRVYFEGKPRGLQPSGGVGGIANFRELAQSSMEQKSKSKSK